MSTQPSTPPNAATQLANTLAGKVRVEFPFPYDTPNGKLTALTFRRGKVRDQLEAQRMAPGDSIRQEIILMTLLADEKITPEDIEELDLGDMAEVQAVFTACFVSADPKTMRQARSLLAKWFSMQPSEIENLDLADFEDWVEDAVAQINERARQLDRMNR
ncbi:phage tail assembly protein [Paraburkholderia fungorum]|uniref:phage tail assembly protein n=1 Tax=Paraburkholderia fungorum TaxID=134537 RepID=UPI00402BEDAE